MRRTHGRLPFSLKISLLVRANRRAFDENWRCGALHHVRKVGAFYEQKITELGRVRRAHRQNARFSFAGCVSLSRSRSRALWSWVLRRWDEFDDCLRVSSVIQHVRRFRRNVLEHAATRRYFKVVCVRSRLSVFRRERFEYGRSYRTSYHRESQCACVRCERMDVRRRRELHADS